MTDKELLELAAKAAGKPLTYSGGTHWYGKQASWNPLTDDGDALRLAVKLKLDVYMSSGLYTWAEYGVAIHKPDKTHKGEDPYAATRRAIVRAAAEIGKEIK